MPYNKTAPQGRPRQADLSTAGTGQPGHGDAVHGRAGTGIPGGVDTAVAGVAGEALGQVVAGLQGGAGPGEFRAGIEAGQRELGNRAFMQWVGELQSGGQDAPAADGAAPLQMMGKKRKHPDTGAEADPGASTPGQAGAGNAGDTGMTPVEKKVKGPRAEVAVKTLRSNGIKAFGEYIEVEIDKMMGLQTKQAFLRELMKRLKNDREAVGVWAGSLALVEEHLCALDLEAVVGEAGLNAPAQGQAPCLALSGRHREAVRRPGRLPGTEAPAGDTGTPPVSGTEVAGETVAAAERVPPLLPEPSPPGETVHGTAPPVSLAQAKNTVREEMLHKFLSHYADQQEATQVLEVVDTAADLDDLCALYEGLAYVERGRWRGWSDAAGPEFALGEKMGLVAEAVDDEIKVYLGRAYHRFVSQAVNDVEFGRGKPVEGYPGLLRATAGVPGLGSCSVFYYLEGSGGRNRVRVAGIGHHLDAETCRLDYAAEELGGMGHTLRIA